jgi:RES domain-containing protein
VAPDQTALPFSAPGSLTAFRYCTYDVPFWARNNTRDGRWNRAGDPPTQYWSLTADAAWAELIRAEDLQTERDLDMLRMPLWACRVQMLGLIDLRDPGHQQDYGLSFAQLISDDWSACHAARAALRNAAPGIVTPCAALDAHANLTLFGPRRAIDWRAKSSLASTLPAALVAIGRPPLGLLPHVRRPAGPASQAPLF